MDILLVYPPISVKERYASDVGDVGGNLPPLGILYLAAYLRDKKISVGLIDAVAENLSIKKLIEQSLELRPKVIGISALTSNYHRAVAFSEELKKVMPEVLVILGGHHATIMPNEVMKSGKFDILVYGEGELTLEDLMIKYKASGWDKKKFMKDYETLDSTKGIVFKKNNKVTITQKRELIPNLDTLPFPAWDLLDMDKYIPLPNQYKRTPVVNMVIIRGCPYNCSFCSNNSVFGRNIRSTSPKRVIQIIRHVMKQYGAREISFWDDMMTANKKWMHEFCRLIIKNKIDVTWTCYSRVDCIDYELLKAMKAAGCWNIFFGYESGNQALLNNINKGITLKQVELANKLCKKVGIEIRASFMLALPGETPETARQTIEFAKKLNPDYAQFSVTTPYPGTKLYKDAKRFGTMKKNFKQYTGWEAVFVPYGYKNRKEIERMAKKATREFYFRPRYILSRITKISTIEDIKRYLKGARFLFGFVKNKKNKGKE